MRPKREQMDECVAGGNEQNISKWRELHHTYSTRDLSVQEYGERERAREGCHDQGQRRSSCREEERNRLSVVLPCAFSFY